MRASSENSADVLNWLLALSRKFSGRSPDADDRLYANLDINGGDFIEFVQAIESEFGIGLDWVSPVTGEAFDPSLREIGQFVVTSEIPPAARQ